MTDTNITRPIPVKFQDPKKQEAFEKFIRRVSEREQEAEKPVVAEPSKAGKPVVVEPPKVHVHKKTPKPESTEDLAEIIALNRKIIDEFNAFDDDNTYTIVENYCLDNPNLGGREMAVYAMLARHCHMPKKTCKVSLVRLSERLGWKRDTINKALDNLTKFGLIERGERDIGGAYTYTLTHRHRSKKKEKKAA